MKTTLDIIFHPDGSAQCLHSDAIPLQVLGTLRVQRASTVEFNESSQEWEVLIEGDSKPKFTNPSRDYCLSWERDYITGRLEKGTACLTS